MTDPAETLNILRGAHKEDLMTGIDEYKIPTSEPEDNKPVHIIPHEGEIVWPNKNSKSSGFMYYNKYSNTDTSAYNRVLNALKKLDTLHNPNMYRMHKSVIKGNYKMTRDTRVVLIVEHEEDEINWACSTSISRGTGEPEAFKEAMTRPNIHLWVMSAISEVNNVFSINAWILTTRIAVKSKVIKFITCQVEI